MSDKKVELARTNETDSMQRSLENKSALLLESPQPQYKRRKLWRAGVLSIERKEDPRTSFWEEKFHELLAYRQKHGNCNVPRGYKPNPALGRWVHTMRVYHKTDKVTGNRKEQFRSACLLLMNAEEPARVEGLLHRKELGPVVKACERKRSFAAEKCPTSLSIRCAQRKGGRNLAKSIDLAVHRSGSEAEGAIRIAPPKKPRLKTKALIHADFDESKPRSYSSSPPSLEDAWPDFESI